MDDPRYEAGMKVRREVLGDEHVDRATDNATDFTRPFQEYITRSAWGEAWTRPGLDRKTRSCITLAILTALRAENEIPMHVRAAKRNGLTDEEILEVLIHTAVLRRRARGELRGGHREQDAQRVTRRGDHFVQSLERGLAVIRAFGPEEPELTLSDVARRTGLTRAAARRFLLTLADLGYVRSDGKHFALTPRVLELGYAYLSSLSLPEIAEPHLERLAAEVRESSSVSVLDGDEIVYVGRVPTSRIMRVSINVGTRFPAHATSMGRVLLAALAPDELDAYLARAELRALTERTITDPAVLRAELDRIRTQGWALVDQELEEGLRSIAAPIRDRDGHVVAAVNVSAHASRASPETVKDTLLTPLLATAARIESDLKDVGTPQARSYH